MKSIKWIGMTQKLYAKIFKCNLSKILAGRKWGHWALGKEKQKDWRSLEAPSNVYTTLLSAFHNNKLIPKIRELLYIWFSEICEETDRLGTMKYWNIFVYCLLLNHQHSAISHWLQYLKVSICPRYNLMVTTVWSRPKDW